MWVQILAATMVLVSLNKTLYRTVLFFTREYGYISLRVDVGIGYLALSKYSNYSLLLFGFRMTLVLKILISYFV